jgi:hypothetical protein
MKSFLIRFFVVYVISRFLCSMFDVSGSSPFLVPLYLPAHSRSLTQGLLLYVGMEIILLLQLISCLLSSSISQVEKLSIRNGPDTCPTFPEVKK